MVRFRFRLLRREAHVNVCVLGVNFRFLLSPALGAFSVSFCSYCYVNRFDRNSLDDDAVMS